jgi:cytochrome P450
MRLQRKIQLKIGKAMVQGLSFVERRLHGVSLNIFDPALTEDPYPFYNRLRTKAPIHYSMALRAWWVTGFELVQEVL